MWSVPTHWCVFPKRTMPRMNVSKNVGRRIFPILLAAAVTASAQPAFAEPNGRAMQYIVTSLKASPHSAEASEEMLTIATVGGNPVVALQNRAGDAVVTPAIVERTGALDIAMADPAVACYNRAMAMISDSTARNVASSLLLGLAGETITVPLKLTIAAPRADGLHTVTAGGTTEARIDDGGAGTLVTFVAAAAVSSTPAGLVAARFDETGVLTKSGTRISLAPAKAACCSITRLETFVNERRTVARKSLAFR